MPQPLSLLDFLRGLQADEVLRSRFAADPEATIDEHGLGHLSPYDVHDALVLMEDNETADFRHDFDAATVHPAPPSPQHYGGDEQAAVAYLSDFVAGTFPAAGPPAVDDSADFGHGDLTGTDTDTDSGTHDGTDPGATPFERTEDVFDDHLSDDFGDGFPGESDVAESHPAAGPAHLGGDENDGPAHPLFG